MRLTQQAIMLSLLLILIGCGQKGPLRLEDPKTAPKASQAPLNDIPTKLDKIPEETPEKALSDQEKAR